MKLSEPIQIGSTELKNRLVMPPMVTNFASETGAVTQRLIDYHVERAKGMVGLIIVEATCVESLLGRLVVNQLRVDSDKFLPGLAELVEAVHTYGAKVALQLHHAGRQTTLEATEGKTPVAPSEVPYVDMYTTPGSVIARPRSLTVEEIGELVQKFGNAAKRAKVAGFDAVEIHGAHGYLIGQFLSPYTNKRNDEYGSNFEGRMRFAVEVIERVRDEVGPKYPLSFRISADEYIEGGMTLELARRVATKLEAATINVIHVSGSLGESNHMCEAPMAIPRGFNVHLAEGIKQVVSIPVIAVGRINDPGLAEKILQEGKADLVAMGRALLADPELPRKIMEGRSDEVRKCIACDLGCSSRLYAGLHITCNVNPDVGKEREFRLTRAESVKEVLVVGGGLAGMEAARVAALRGHNVTICEKKSELGGQFILAAKPPHKEELQNILDYLRAQMSKLDVHVEMRQTITPERIEEKKPDAVVVATGGVPLVPRVPGIESERVATAWDVLAGQVDPKDEVAIVGGGEVGCETAEYLSDLGRDVTLVEAVGDLALDMEPLNRYLLLHRLREKRIKTFTRTIFKEVVNDGIAVTDDRGERLLRAESVILALGTVSDNTLANSLRGRVEQLYVVGDCVKPRRSLEAIHEGSWAARQI
jgi:2,4-dienoyl-CoA reductase-like NADH-dependent reductase (Old Yellow Enzyme family)/thioredoxin reductase